MRQVSLLWLIAISLTGFAMSEESTASRVAGLRAEPVFRDLESADLVLVCDYDEARGLVVTKTLKGYVKPGTLWNSVREKGPVLVLQRGGGADEPDSMRAWHYLIGSDGTIAVRDFLNGETISPTGVSLREVEAHVERRK